MIRPLPCGGYTGIQGLAFSFRTVAGVGGLGRCFLPLGH
jgi:hypothetical protein